MLKLSGIHNFSNVQFAFREKIFLSNGLKFIMTPSSSSKQYFLSKQHIINTWLTFKTKLKRHIDDLNFDNINENNETNIYIPKFHIKNTHHHYDPNPTQLPNIEFNAYIQYTSTLLESKLKNIITINKTKRIKSNTTNEQFRFISNLINDKNITIVPSDKNLGITIVNTEWYKSTLKTMLQDRITYKYIGTTCSIHISTIVQPIYTKIQNIFKQHKDSNSISSLPGFNQMKKYLKNKITPSTSKIPCIYLLPKIHKPGTLKGRPIVPASHWITSSASVIVDYLLQPLCKNIPWLVRDSIHCISQLQSMKIPKHIRKQSILMTADIGSLYTNIDTELGLKCVQQFLLDHHVDSYLQSFILDLLKIIMTENYFRFGNCIYQQIDGCSMGTSCAPCYANIVVYQLEKNMIKQLFNQKHIYIYFRYLDDIFALIDPKQRLSIIKQFNSLHRRLTFDFQSDNEKISFLDILIIKDDNFYDNGIFTTSVYQKKLNLYNYIPYSSYHPLHSKIGFISSELKRYIKLCSNIKLYIEMKNLFYDRLLDRGYGHVLLQKIFNSIFYCNRTYYIDQHIKYKNIDNKIHNINNCSLLLSKRFDTVESAIGHVLISQHDTGYRNGVQEFNNNPHCQYSNTNISTLLYDNINNQYKQNIKIMKESSRIPIPLYYDRLTNALDIRGILMCYYEFIYLSIHESTKTPKTPMIAYKSKPSLMKLLVHAKRIKHQKDSLTQQPQTKTKQQQLTKYFVR
jgi:hypothetical protein